MTIASTTPAAQSDDPVLDELIGTATNTALLPEPDAHAYDDIATGDADPLVLGGHKFTSRFILGSGRYDLNLIKATIENAGTQIVIAMGEGAKAALSASEDRIKGII